VTTWTTLGIFSYKRRILHVWIMVVVEADESTIDIVYELWCNINKSLEHQAKDREVLKKIYKKVKEEGLV